MLVFGHAIYIFILLEHSIIKFIFTYLSKLPYKLTSFETINRFFLCKAFGSLREFRCNYFVSYELSGKVKLLIFLFAHSTPFS